jgi:hypothetical protein
MKEYNCDVMYKQKDKVFRVANLPIYTAYKYARELSKNKEIQEIRVFSIRMILSLPFKTDLFAYTGARHHV